METAISCPERPHPRVLDGIVPSPQAQTSGSCFVLSFLFINIIYLVPCHFLLSVSLLVEGFFWIRETWGPILGIHLGLQHSHLQIDTFEGQKRAASAPKTFWHCTSLGLQPSRQGLLGLGSTTGFSCPCQPDAPEIPMVPAADGPGPLGGKTCFISQDAVLPQGSGATPPHGR